MSRYQGDLKIEIGKDGAAITYIGGQPVLDQGIINAVIISLFTSKPWIGNIFARKAGQKIGSIFEAETRKPITSQSPNFIRFAAESALKWMKDKNGLNAKITVDVKNPASDTISVNILIKSPVIGNANIGLTRYAGNWIATAEAN